MAENKLAKHINSITPLHERDNVCEMTPADCMEEMLGMVKLMYSDTQRILRAINAEINVYSDMIDRAATQEDRDKLAIAQAQAAQKPAVQARTADAILDALKTLYTISKEEQNVKDNRVVIVDDMSDFSGVGVDTDSQNIEGGRQDTRAGRRVALRKSNGGSGNTDSQ